MVKAPTKEEIATEVEAAETARTAEMAEINETTLRLNAATEARASRRVTTHVRLPLVSSDVNKGRARVTVMETGLAVEAEASQIVAVRVVAAESDSEGAAREKKDPRLPTPSTEKWRTTGSRPVTKTRQTTGSTTIWRTISPKTLSYRQKSQPKARKKPRLRRKRRSEL